MTARSSSSPTLADLPRATGLVPFGDWIVGYAGGILRGEGDFYDVVEAVGHLLGCAPLLGKADLPLV